MRECEHLIDVGHYTEGLHPLSHLILKMTIQGAYCSVCYTKRLKLGPKKAK